MRLKRIEKFTKTLSQGLLPSQQLALSQVVCGILLSRCLILAEIACCFETTVDFCHNLKRAFHFADNERLSEQRSKEILARRLINQLRHRLDLKPNQHLEIIIDWTSVYPFQVLSALIPLEGRAVPVLQWAVEDHSFERSQNAFEQQFIASLSGCLPPNCKVVVVADRGFGRTELFRFLREQGLSYVIRVKGDAWIEASNYSGCLKDYPLSVGQTFKLSQVSYHKTKRYQLNVVLNCAKVKGKESSWLIVTDLPMTGRQIVGIYKRRFWCEESFRDQKQEFELEGVRVKEARRLENLLMALAIVFMILAVIGMRGKCLGKTEKYSVKKKHQEVLSWVQIALKMLRETTAYLNLLFRCVSSNFFFRWA